MSVIIRVSYKEPYELDVIVDKLSPLVDDIKKQPGKGRFKLAYLQMRGIPRPLTGTHVRDKMVVAE